MRTMQNEVCVATYEALGATPVALASGEQFTGLQNGVVDGTDNSALYAVADGYIEVVNNICVSIITIPAVSLLLLQNGMRV